MRRQLRARLHTAAVARTMGIHPSQKVAGKPLKAELASAVAMAAAAKRFSAARNVNGHSVSQPDLRTLVHDASTADTAQAQHFAIPFALPPPTVATPNQGASTLSKPDWMLRNEAPPGAMTPRVAGSFWAGLANVRPDYSWSKSAAAVRNGGVSKAKAVALAQSRAQVDLTRAPDSPSVVHSPAAELLSRYRIASMSQMFDLQDTAAEGADAVNRRVADSRQAAPHKSRLPAALHSRLLPVDTHDNVLHPTLQPALVVGTRPPLSAVGPLTGLAAAAAGVRRRSIMMIHSGAPIAAAGTTGGPIDADGPGPSRSAGNPAAHDLAATAATSRLAGRPQGVRFCEEQQETDDAIESAGGVEGHKDSEAGAQALYGPAFASQAVIGVNSSQSCWASSASSNLKPDADLSVSSADEHYDWLASAHAALSEAVGSGRHRVIHHDEGYADLQAHRGSTGGRHHHHHHPLSYHEGHHHDGHHHHSHQGHHGYHRHVTEPVGQTVPHGSSSLRRTHVPAGQSAPAPASASASGPRLGSTGSSGLASSSSATGTGLGRGERHASTFAAGARSASAFRLGFSLPVSAAGKRYLSIVSGSETGLEAARAGPIRVGLPVAGLMHPEHHNRQYHGDAGDAATQARFGVDGPPMPSGLPMHWQGNSESEARVGAANQADAEDVDVDKASLTVALPAKGSSGVDGDQESSDCNVDASVPPGLSNAERRAAEYTSAVRARFGGDGPPAPDVQALREMALQYDEIAIGRAELEIARRPHTDTAVPGRGHAGGLAVHPPGRTGPHRHRGHAVPPLKAAFPAEPPAARSALYNPVGRGSPAEPHPEAFQQQQLEVQQTSADADAHPHLAGRPRPGPHSARESDLWLWAEEDAIIQGQASTPYFGGATGISPELRVREQRTQGRVSDRVSRAQKHLSLVALVSPVLVAGGHC